MISSARRGFSITPNRRSHRRIAASWPVLSEFPGKKFSPRFRGVAANRVSKLVSKRQREEFIPGHAKLMQELISATQIQMEKSFVKKCLPVQKRCHGRRREIDSQAYAERFPFRSGDDYPLPLPQTARIVSFQ